VDAFGPATWAVHAGGGSAGDNGSAANASRDAFQPGWYFFAPSR
jgi:hypothetical protein